MNKDLAAVQRLFVDAIRRPSALADDRALAPQLAALLKEGTPPLSGTARLEIYREQFWLRHLANLRDDYPTLAWATGSAARFERVARDYLSAFPPRHWNLQRLGADMPEFVATVAPWHEEPILRDAAKLDWAFVAAFDAPDAPPFDPRQLIGATEELWPTARVTFHPSLAAMKLAFPLHEVRDAVKLAEHPPRPAEAVTGVVVWRDARSFLRAKAMAPAAYELVSALAKNTPLGEACERVARQADDCTDLDSQIGSWFQEWTAAGWLVGLRFGDV